MINCACKISLTVTSVKMAVFWDVAPYIDDTSEEHTTSIIRMTEAVSSSELLVSIYQTVRCNIPEESHFQNAITEISPTIRVIYQVVFTG
jgi:hypothetical protein